MIAVEDRLRAALRAGTAAVEDTPDLFARVLLSIDDDRLRRQRRARAFSIIACLVGATGALIVAVTEPREGKLLMDWWILEVMTTVLLLALALWLGPFIKRFGKSYAADVFRSNPRTGKSFILLTDIAYYLIFLSYVLFTVSYEPRPGWSETVNAQQLQFETARVAGILLIIGLLHGINLLALPVMGRLLTLNRRLDDDTSTPPARPAG